MKSLKKLPKPQTPIVTHICSELPGCNDFQCPPVGGDRAPCLTCLLRPDNEQLGEAITCFLFGPDVLVSFVLTWILEPDKDKQSSTKNGRHKNVQCENKIQGRTFTVHLSLQQKQILLSFAAQSYLPQWIFLIGEQTEVFLGQRHRWQGLQLQIGPRPHEHHQTLKGVKTKAIVPIVGQMCHEDTYLHGTRYWSETHFWG